ncbi:hypothetical protein HID58_033755 [Brassica napus]|uniref:Uncharacterized protein n=1 Tax=Brassica napus TaxID=3708 RepID=A0ABQ8C052_BRANA|nr:hypothetical protein HID58_033755 [Brassica napus]
MVESVLPELAEEIYLVKPSLLKAEDAFCWLKTKTGDYSVKSGAIPARTTVDKATSSAREWLLAQATSSPNHSSPPQSEVFGLLGWR